jgi:predicted dehydrogenase
MIKIGILGCGKIAHRFVKGAQETSNSTVIACAARELDRAQEFANQYSIEYVYDNYDNLVKNPEVHAVYIATPPFMHEEQIRLCLEHNKHVISEKPFVSNRQISDELFEIAKSKGLVLMEANKTVFTPTWVDIKRKLDDKAIGEVMYAEGSYTYRFPIDDHWVFDPKRMGGGMFDVGVYPLTVSLYLFGLDIKRMTKMSLINSKGSDDLTNMLIEFNNKKMVSVKGGIGLETDNHYTIYGSEGKIRCPRFSKSPYYFIEKYGYPEETIKFEFNSEFAFEIEHFAKCIEEGLSESPIMSQTMSGVILDLINSKGDK